MSPASLVGSEVGVHRFEVAAAIADQRVIGIVRAADRIGADAAVDALLDAGLRVVEVSLTTPGALDSIAAVAARGIDGLVLGAGTVLDAASARLAVLAGARFLVSPAVSRPMIRTAHRYGAAAIPGAASATEIVRALDCGADLVKLFPASAYGPRATGDLLAALPQAPLVPTGGVTLDDAADYVRVGAVAVGMGAALTRGGPQAAGERVGRLLADLAAAAPA